MFIWLTIKQVNKLLGVERCNDWKRKNVSRKWYDANFDQDLINERARAKDICFELNHTKPSDKNKRKELIDELFQTTTDNVSISIPFDTDYGWNVKLGKMSM